MRERSAGGARGGDERGEDGSVGTAVEPDTVGPLDTGTVEASDTGIEQGCGNGIVEAGETCDDQGESATCDVDCTDVVCGDSNVNAMAGEACEGEDLAGGICEGFGFDGGTLSCDGACSYDTNGCAYLPDAPVLTLGFSQVKRFDFSWAAAMGAEFYQLVEGAAPGEPFVQVGGDVVGENSAAGATNRVRIACERGSPRLEIVRIACERALRARSVFSTACERHLRRAGGLRRWMPSRSRTEHPRSQPLRSVLPPAAAS